MALRSNTIYRLYHNIQTLIKKSNRNMQKRGEKTVIKLKQIRLAKGISKYRIAKETGMQYQSIDAVEKGGDLRVSTLRKIAKALNVDVKELLQQLEQ